LTGASSEGAKAYGRVLSMSSFIPAFAGKCHIPADFVVNA